VYAFGSITIRTRDVSSRPRKPHLSKYQPLQEFLREQSSSRLELSFVEIERIIGNELPPSAYAPRWWISGRNCRRNPLWQDAWRNAGYDAALLPGSDRVEFRRLS
jgi:hypothetical protein